MAALLAGSSSSCAGVALVSSLGYEGMKPVALITRKSRKRRVVAARAVSSSALGESGGSGGGRGGGGGKGTEEFGRGGDGEGGGGRCPLRRVALVGRLVDILSGETPVDQIRCPPMIVAMRAAISSTPAVRALRPRALPLKLMVVMLLAMAANFPLGVARAHVDKFSVAWFVIVHASIPAVVLVRKSLLIPRPAALGTIAAAVLGQSVGARVGETSTARKLSQSLTAFLSSLCLSSSFTRVPPVANGTTREAG